MQKVAVLHFPETGSPPLEDALAQLGLVPVYLDEPADQLADTTAVVVRHDAEEVDGLATIRRIRSEIGYDGPVLAVTTTRRRDQRGECLAAGADEVMWADADRDEALTRVRALLALSPAPAILIIEDDDIIAESLVGTLNRTGFETLRAKTIAEATAAFEGSPIDALIVDRSLKHIKDGKEVEEDGKEFIEKLRERGISTPALILSAFSEPRHRIEGLGAGAEDYMGKPFEDDELLARLQVLLRPRVSDDVLVFGPLQVFRRDRLVRWRSRRLELTEKEFRLLIYLIEREGIVIPVSMLREDVFNVLAQFEKTNQVQVTVYRLRKCLKEAGVPHIVLTEGDGYLFRSQPLRRLHDPE